jgi:hypothetical protein
MVAGGVAEPVALEVGEALGAPGLGVSRGVDVREGLGGALPVPGAPPSEGVAEALPAVLPVAQEVAEGVASWPVPVGEVECVAGGVTERLMVSVTVAEACGVAECVPSAPVAVAGGEALGVEEPLAEPVPDGESVSEGDTLWLRLPQAVLEGERSLLGEGVGVKPTLGEPLPESLKVPLACGVTEGEADTLSVPLPASL